MILLKAGTAGLKDEPIKEWKVMFRTTYGITANLAAAIKSCEDLGINPDLGIVPVAVAVTESSYEIVMK